MQLLMWLVDYITTQNVTVQVQGKKSKVNNLSNGTPQGSNTIQHGDQSTTTTDLDSKVQMVAYADDLVIYGGPIGGDILYKQKVTTQNKMSNILTSDNRTTTEMQVV